MTTLRGIAQLSDCLLTHMLLAYWRKLLQTISKLSRSAIIAGDPYRKRSRDVREPAPAEAPSHHLASTRRVVGDHRTDPPRTRSTKEHRSSSRRPACRSGRDHLQDEKRGPVEPTAQRRVP